MMNEDDMIRDDNNDSEEELRQRKRQLIELQDMLKNPAFRNFMRRLMTQCGVGHEMFNCDPYMHAHNAGRRSIGLWLETEIILSGGTDHLNILINE